MKKSIKLTIVFALALMLCGLFAIFASAETFTVQYIQMSWESYKHKDSSDANGQITLRDVGYTTDATEYEITGLDGNKTTVQRQLYGWYDEEGNFYEKGATITLTKNLILREAFGFEVYTATDLNNYLGNHFWYVRLGADITATTTIGTQRTGNGSTSTLDLNGHTFTSTAEYAFAGQRCGFIIIGNGTINHTYTGTNGGLWNSTVHGYGEGQQRLWICKGVTVNTTGALLHSTNAWSATKENLLVIYGTTTSAYLANTLSVPEGKTFKIYEGANVTVTQPELIKNRSTATTKQITVYIYGGTLNLPQNADFFTDILRNRYEITGGSFVNKLPNDFLKNGYDCIYNDQTGLYDVQFVACSADGSNGVHNFKLQEAYNNKTATCLAPGFHYYRCECGSAYVDEVSALGHDYSVISIQKIATTTETGIKEVSCSRCDDSYTYEYSFDPRDQVITIVVKTQDGTKEITGAVRDFYLSTVVETSTSYESSLNGIATIKDPDNSEITYTVADIVKIEIPAGFTSLSANAIANASALEEIVLFDGANVVFATDAIKNCASLKKITVGNATVTFKERALNNCTAFEALDVENANVTFETNSFKDSSIKNLKLGKDKKYSFGKNSFYKAKLESLVFPDGTNPIANGGTSLVTFPGEAAFYGSSLKYVYFGANVIAPNNKGEIWINNKPFDCSNYLELVVLMDVTHIDQYSFCCAASGDTTKDFREMSTVGLTVYHHAAKLSLNDNTFVNRSYYGVTFYTTCAITALKNCKYTVYTGIPHAYIEGNVDATCTAMGSTGYSTNCQCGVVSDATYTVYSTFDTAINSTTGSIVIGQTTDALGHEFDTENGATITETIPATCIKDAIIVYKCARCDETMAVVQEGTVTGHTPAEEWEIMSNATCLGDGFKQKTCTVCKTIAEGEVIPATGHSANGQWTVIAEGTCTVGATRVQYCANGCGEAAITEAVEPKGHTPSEQWVIDVVATCTKMGVKYQRCSECNAICESITIDALGHEFDVADGAVVCGMEYANGFDKVGAILTKCARCTETSGAEVAPIFSAKGYATNPTRDSINGGYIVNTELLALYESYNGAITYGVVIANANAFTGSFFVGGTVNTDKAIQVPITTKAYSNFDCTITGFGANSSTLELVICAYVIDENGDVSFIQAENNYAVATEIGGQAFTKVTLDLVLANVAEQPDANIPSNDEE